uniref:Uncharacterized protein n=1 Tax=Rhizophora mucronata TaxID=61149 RepID=A0A2P2PF12_RHIMU
MLWPCRPNPQQPTISTAELCSEGNQRNGAV